MATISRGTRLAFLLLLLNFLTVSPATQDDLVIDTRHGKVQGKLLSVLGSDVRAFLGIPYGKPPLGKRRFGAPEPVERWDGVKDATKYQNTCYQFPDTTFPGFQGSEMWNPNTPMSEDCLYLNVWTPQTKPSSLSPVLVWIYGGGFTDGSSSLDIYDGRFLSKSEGVVVVSMNYRWDVESTGVGGFIFTLMLSSCLLLVLINHRLGAFGFLSLPDNKNIQSNAGLLDQRLALRWVANNIAAFGGDSKKVTLFGESAGAASVGLHLLSPGSQDLFHRAVMQSAAPNAPWARISQNEAWRRSMKLATLLGCPHSPPAAMEACLQQADPLKITTKQHEVFINHQAIALPFVPHVDRDFLPDEVEVLLSSGNLPKKEVLFGLNKDEGTYFLFYGAAGINLTHSLITRNELQYRVALLMPHASDVTVDAAIFQYTDWTDVNNKMKNRDSVASLYGDQMFSCPLLEFAQRYSQRGGKSFFYYFDHRSSVNPWPEWTGVMHGYEIEFIFGRPLNASLGYMKNEVNMTKKFMKHWGNFARTGNPSIDGANWPAFTHEQQEYVTLNYNHPELKTMMKAKECHLWGTLLPKVQKVSDDLLSCEKANGIILHCNSILLLILLVITLTY